MPPKGGVSLEEKRKRILQIFKANAQVYSLKEIEQIGSKKGVVAQTIKDILKGLCDDNLVDTDKIGSGNFYWALPSKDGQRKRTRLNALNQDLSTHKAKKAAIEKKMAVLRDDRLDSKKRQDGLASVSQLKKEESELRTELKKYEDRDPTVLAALTEKISSCMEHATRWGGNLAAVVDYLHDKQRMPTDQIFQAIGASENDVEPIDWEYFDLAESA